MFFDIAYFDAQSKSCVFKKGFTMKFRLKVTMAMISLVSVLFGIGITVFLWLSFGNSLEREKDAAAKSFNTVINTVTMFNQLSVWTSTEEIANDFKKIAEKNELFYDMRLRKDDETIYQKKAKENNFLTDLTSSAGTDRVVYEMTENSDKEYIQFCSEISVGPYTLYIDAVYDVSRLYAERKEQLNIYALIFTVVLVCGSILSYVLSYILTQNISRLRKTAAAISQGDYSVRCHLKSSDEIGDLSKEFNHMTDSLVEKMDEQAMALERQNQFIGNFTHELKTPMTSIIGYADLIRSGRLEGEDMQDAANYIFSEGKRLERLSIKMLDLVVAGKDNTELSLLSPALFIENIVNHSRPLCEESGISIETTLEEGKCRLEPDYFSSLVINLIENARRAMAEGGQIHISLSMTSEGCILVVSDNGCGIPEDKLMHIKEAFYRVDKARSRSFGGAGLGLTLCDAIAKMHNGNLEIESREGEGTSVKAELKGGRT